MAPSYSHSFVMASSYSVLRHGSIILTPSSSLAGSGESGKSTIVKQMKIIHQNGFSREELLTYRLTVYRNLVDSAQAIVLAMRKIGIDCETPSNRVSGVVPPFFGSVFFFFVEFFASCVHFLSVVCAVPPDLFCSSCPLSLSRPSHRIYSPLPPRQTATV